MLLVRHDICTAGDTHGGRVKESPICEFGLMHEEVEVALTV